VAANPKVLKSVAEKQALAKSVQEWIRGRVAKHKYLRGGCVVIDAIPKRYAFFFLIHRVTKLVVYAYIVALLERYSERICVCWRPRNWPKLDRS
jgi:hypothetical protein